MKNIFSIAFALLLLASCQQAEVPTQYADSKALPKIYPDYIDVTIPVNIAPLSLQLMQDADEVVTRYSAEGEEIVCGGRKAMPDIDDWKALAAKAAGKDITVEVFAKNRGAWTRYRPFAMHVSPDSIDSYISYRLIAPSYVTYEDLTINQRNLENYDESVVYANMLLSTEKDGQCINCHNYQAGNPQRMQFHARHNHGGTVVAYDGKIKKVNMKNDSILSAGVYPSWHPWLKLIAYSTNKTMQSFHTRDINKIEVLDSQSDLIIYDIDNNTVTNIENDSTEFECYPSWSPDGKWLYYVSAHFEYRDTIGHDTESIMRAEEIKYSIYRKPFNPETMQFGTRELVFDAASLGKSATLPRLSPDGQYLLFTMGGWGCFHIWHRDADLYMLRLSDAKVWPLTKANSPMAESFHNWSSNGKWIIFSSRRTDGVYTRLFFAHVDSQGNATKAFELPQADPDYHRQFMKSYNVPEFMRGPVTIKPQDFADVLKNDNVEPVKYR